jgi:hypothetical protein
MNFLMLIKWGKEKQNDPLYHHRNAANVPPPRYVMLLLLCRQIEMKLG